MIDTQGTSADIPRSFYVNMGQAIFMTLFFLFFVYITIKVYKIIQFTDLYIICMLACWTLHALASVVFYTLVALVYHPYTEGQISDDTIFCLNISALLFLNIAVTLNCRNW